MIRAIVLKVSQQSAVATSAQRPKAAFVSTLSCGRVMYPSTGSGSSCTAAHRAARQAAAAHCWNTAAQKLPRSSSLHYRMVCTRQYYSTVQRGPCALSCCACVLYMHMCVYVCVYYMCMCVHVLYVCVLCVCCVCVCVYVMCVCMGRSIRLWCVAVLATAMHVNYTMCVMCVCMSCVCVMCVCMSRV